MLNKLSINLRVLMLIIIPLIIFGVIGYSSFKDYQKQEINLQNTNKNLNIIKIGNDLNTAIETNYTFILSKLRQGKVSWEKSTEKAVKGEAIVYKSFEDFNAVLPESLLDKKLLNEFAVAFADINNNTTGMVDEAYTSSKTNSGLIIFGSLLMIAIGFLIARSIKVAIKELNNVVTGFAEGDFDLRADVKGTDELANLSTAFNSLLDDRAVTLTSIDEEHKELNESVFNLLQAVGRNSRYT